MKCFSCQEKLSLSNRFSIFIDGNYSCISCDLKFSLNNKFLHWYSLLVDFVLFPLSMFVALIYSRIWLSVTVSMLVLFIIQGRINYYIIKNHMRILNKNTPSGIKK